MSLCESQNISKRKNQKQTDEEGTQKLTDLPEKKPNTLQNPKNAEGVIPYWIQPSVLMKATRLFVQTAHLLMTHPVLILNLLQSVLKLTAHSIATRTILVKGYYKQEIKNLALQKMSSIYSPLSMIYLDFNVLWYGQKANLPKDMPQEYADL